MTVSPRCEEVVKIKRIPIGKIIILQQKIQNYEIPECLDEVNNGPGLTSTVNNTTEPIMLNFSESINAEPFEEKYFQKSCYRF